MARHTFTNCSRRCPCPICGAQSRCAINVTLGAVYCRTPDIHAEDMVAGVSKDGTPYWKYSLDSERIETYRVAAENSIRVTDFDTLDTVYSAMLASLCVEGKRAELLPHHREHLAHDRKLTDRTIESHQYRSFHSSDTRAVLYVLLQLGLEEKLAGVPGFYQEEGSWKIGCARGILIPMRDEYGRVRAIKVRHDGEGDCRYSMMSSSRWDGPSALACVHFPLGRPVDIGTIRITEGELKADYVQQETRIPTLSIPGVSTYDRVVPAIRALERVNATAGARVTKVMDVLIAFDADLYSNPRVLKSLKGLVADIRAQEGITPHIEVWQDKSQKGIDDALRAGVDIHTFSGDELDNIIRNALRAQGEPDDEDRIVHLVKQCLEAGTAQPLFEEEETIAFLAGIYQDEPRLRQLFLERIAKLPGTSWRTTLKEAIANYRRTSDLIPEEMEVFFEEHDAKAGEYPVIETNNRSDSEIRMDCLLMIAKANDPPYIFSEGAGLCFIERNAEGVYVKKEWLPSHCQSLLFARAQFARTSEKGRVLVPTPKLLGSSLYRTPGFNQLFPTLRGIIHAPSVSKEGTLLTEPGYDSESGIFYAPPPHLPMPEVTHVTYQEMREAVEWINYNMLLTMPTVAANDKAHAWALMLLPFIRPYIKGPTPLFSITAPTAGTGKGLLYHACTAPFYGGEVPFLKMPVSREELSKILTGKLREYPSHVFFDNVPHEINSDDLAALLTQTECSRRVLGSSTVLNLPINCVWTVAGNNLRMSKELHRRNLWIRMDSKAEDPYKLKFEVDLKPFIDANIAVCREKILTCVQWWMQQGLPVDASKSLGSYNHFVQVMGGLLKECGIEGFLMSDAELVKAGLLSEEEVYGDEEAGVSDEEQEWAIFVEEWWARHQGERVTANDLYELVHQKQLFGEEKFHTTPFPGVAFGRFIGARQGSITNGKRLARVRESQRSCWCLQVMHKETHLRTSAAYAPRPVGFGLKKERVDLQVLEATERRAV